MRKIIKTSFHSQCVSFFVLLTLLQYGCEKPESTSIEVSPAEIEVSSDDNDIVITIQSNTSWRIVGTPTWAVFSSLSGNGDSNINVSITSTKESREAVVRVVTEYDSKTLTIIQNGIIIPADAPEIDGANTGMGYLYLSVPSIENATSYRWYHNGSRINGANTQKIKVTESGTYNVEGVNDNGSGRRSPDKVVTITEMDFMGKVVGTWNIEEIVLIYDDEYGWGEYEYLYSFVIEKNTATQALITGFGGPIAGIGESLGRQVVYVDLDIENETLQIKSQELLPTWFEGGYATHLSALQTGKLSDDIWIDLLPVPINEMIGSKVVKLVSPMGNVNGVEYGYHISALKDDAWAGLLWYTVNCRWIKVSDEVNYDVLESANSSSQKKFTPSINKYKFQLNTNTYIN